MNKLTGALCAMALLFGLNTSAQAQEEKAYKTYPHMFIGVQGGAQTTLTNCNMFDIMTPTAAVSIGANFNRVVGTRLHVNGIWNQGMLKDSKFKYDYKYVTTDLDLLLNVTNLFRKGDDHVFNFILIGGVGLNTAWGNDDLNNATALNANMPYMWDGTHLTHNARIGAQLNFNCSKVLDFNIEIAANSLGDRYNSKMNNKDDWQITAMAGIAFKFGYKKKTAPVVPDFTPTDDYSESVNTESAVVEPKPVVEEKPAVVEKPVVVEPAKKEFNIFYSIAKADITGEYQPVVDEVVKFMNEHPKAVVTITGYADKGTGNATVNQQWARRRVENVTKALVKAGVPKNRIKADHKGDTIQPFAENDKNRVVIGVAEEK